MAHGQVFEELYGPYTAELKKNLSEISPSLSDVIHEVAYEQFWSRPGLDLKTKSLITITTLVALGKEDQLKIHLRGFLNCGGTLEELEHTFIHQIVYCGFPAVMNAFKVLKDVQSNK
jgi:4-carboxymuconolactone decarboxylase